jgi:hypothetical protein
MFNTFRRQVSHLLDSGPRQAMRKASIESRGTFRQKESYSLITRPNYAYGMLRAADMARFAGKKKATVCEFGVATGNGLMNMVELAAVIQKETGIEIRVVGMDSGAGLPIVEGYADHPEIWSPGDFAMTNREELKRRVGDKAELIFGDIADTVDGFVASLDESAPLGFISVDVDIYTGSRSALRCLKGRPELYAPAISVYMDDTQFFFANRWCGELLAVEEFNQQNAMRKIDEDRSLPGHRPDSITYWYRSMFVCHILDHELRTKPQARERLSLEDHFAFMKESSLF